MQKAQQTPINLTYTQPSLSNISIDWSISLDSKQMQAAYIKYIKHKHLHDGTLPQQEVH